MHANMEEIKKCIQIKGMQLAHHSLIQHQAIHNAARAHFREGTTILLHSSSETVLDVLQNVSEQGVKINIIVTEGSPSDTGAYVKDRCTQMGL